MNYLLLAITAIFSSIGILIACLWCMLQFLYRCKLLSDLPITVASAPKALLYIVLLILLFAPTLTGFFADVIMNNTLVPVVLKGGWFQEWTFSTRLERLCVVDDSEYLDKDLCIQVALAINRVCPTHDHIKAVLNQPSNQ
jgi:hypothetical protein